MRLWKRSAICTFWSFQISNHTTYRCTIHKEAKHVFCSILDSKRHDAHAVWGHLTPVLEYVKDAIDSNIISVHFASDGPTAQYRNRSNAYLMSTVPFKMGYTQVSWSYYEAGHGKGAPDGVGAAVK